jgi:hypothetical protein
MSTSLEHEISRISALRDLLKFHDETATAIDTLRIKVEKLEAQPTVKNFDQLQETKKHLEFKKMQLNSFYKGFYFFTLPLNSKLKSINLRRMVSNYGATVLVTSHTLLSSSRQLLNELSISPTQAISETSQILDLLALKPLDEPPEGLPGPHDGLGASPPWIESLYYSALQSMTAPGFISTPPAPPAPTYSTSPAAGGGKMPATDAAPSAPAPAAGSDELFTSTSPSKNPFDDVDSVVAGPSIGAGAETAAAEAAPKKSTNPFDDDSSDKSAVKITTVESPRVNQELLGDLIGGDDAKKGNQSSIWG